VIAGTQVDEDRCGVLGTATTHSRLIPARNSGHYVHNDEPQLVIDPILWVLGGGA